LKPKWENWAVQWFCTQSGCRASFGNNLDLKEHRWHMHGGPRPKHLALSPKPISTIWRCSKCKQDFRNEAALLKHRNAAGFCPGYKAIAQKKWKKKTTKNRNSKVIGKGTDIMNQWGQRLPGSGWAGRGQR
jgi:hypothetical protein